MRNFWLGFFCAQATLSLYQDALGKEKYLKLVDIGWVDTSWWMWAILAIILVLCVKEPKA